MTVERFKKMFQYNYWANDRMWQHITPLTDEQFYRPCDYSIGSLHQQLVHMMSVEELWLKRAKAVNASLGLAVPDDFPTRDDIASHWQTIRHDWIVYLDELTEKALDAEITITSVPDGTQYQCLCWEAIAQVLNHSTDHRAQILSLVHQVGGTSDAQDFIYYVWGK